MKTAGSEQQLASVLRKILRDEKYLRQAHKKTEVDYSTSILSFLPYRSCLIVPASSFLSYRSQVIFCSSVQLPCLSEKRKALLLLLFPELIPYHILQALPPDFPSMAAVIDVEVVGNLLFGPQLCGL